MYRILWKMLKQSYSSLYLSRVLHSPAKTLRFGVLERDSLIQHAQKKKKKTQDSSLCPPQLLGQQDQCLYGRPKLHSLHQVDLHLLSGASRLVCLCNLSTALSSVSPITPRTCLCNSSQLVWQKDPCINYPVQPR